MQEVSSIYSGQPSVAPQPPMSRQRGAQGDSFTVGITDNKGFIIFATITEDDKKAQKVFVANDIESLIKLIMEIAPNMVSGSGVKCCDKD